MSNPPEKPKGSRPYANRPASNFLIFLGSLCILGAMALFYHNYQLDQMAAASSHSVVYQFQNLVTPTDKLYPSTEDIPLDELHNEGIYIDGNLYLGVLEIPILGVTLPVHLDWSDYKLTTAPCAYMGNLSEGDLVIAGHNYPSHFRGLRTLNPGDKMTITDTNGYVYRYQVAERSVIHMSQVETLTDRAQWDLTLFTCDYPDRSQRIMIRCVLE